MNIKYIIYTVIIILLFSLSQLCLAENEQINKKEIIKSDSINRPIEKTIEYYKNKKIIKQSNYYYKNEAWILESNVKYIYDKNNLLSVVEYRSPNFDFIFKRIKYNYKTYGNKNTISDKTTINYIDNTIERIQFEYNTRFKLLKTTQNKIINEKITETKESEYYYDSKGNLIETLEYNIKTNQDIYSKKIKRYFYNDTDKLSEIKVFGENKNLEEIIKYKYDFNGRLYTEEHYKTSVIISESNMYFERKTTLDYKLNYNYY